jgi:nucleotide-binding universal stress UspA family protein
MYRKILVGYDDSDQGRDAVALGKQLAGDTGAELVVAGVFQFDPVWGDADARFRDADSDFESAVEAAAQSAGGRAATVPSSSPAHGLHELAEEIGADLIVVGSARHGKLGQIFAGSTGLALLHGAPCPVAIAPRGYREHAEDQVSTVAVGFDGSEEAGRALMAASRLAADAHARLNVISVAVPPPVTYGKGGSAGRQTLLDAIADQARERLSEARSAVPDDVEVDGTLITGDPVEALTGGGDAPGTVMVVGSRGYGPVRRVLLGSVSTPLVRSAPCPVIITPRGMHGEKTEEPAEALETAS